MGRPAHAVAAGVINWFYGPLSSRRWVNFLLAVVNAIVREKLTKTSSAFSGCSTAAEGHYAYFPVTDRSLKKTARETKAIADSLAHAFRKRRDQAWPC